MYACILYVFLYVCTYATRLYVYTFFLYVRAYVHMYVCTHACTCMCVDLRSLTRSLVCASTHPSIVLRYGLRTPPTGAGRRRDPRCGAWFGRGHQLLSR